MQQNRPGRQRPAGFRVWFSIFMVMMLVIGGCGASDEGTQGSQSTRPDETATPQAATPTPAPGEPTITPTEPTLSVDVTRAAPDVSMADREALVEGLNRFALELYQAATASSDENLIYSPASISLAFSMVYAGARGETEAQIADVLGFLPQEQQHPAANALDQHLASLGDEESAGDVEQGEPFQLSIANAIWGQQSYPFLDVFLETLAAQYGAELGVADFETQAEAARQEINAWVAERTEGRIEEALPEGILNEMTRLVLANAIYFKAGWAYPFDEDNTSDGDLTLLDGTEATVPMMRQDDARVRYVEGDGYRAAALPYAGGSVDMLVILPDEERFAEVEAAMMPEILDEIHAIRETSSLTLAMPKFDFESDLALHNVLPDMGMPDPFDDIAADFSGMADPEQLFIAAALHKATIAVDEKGTEAAAVTVVVMEDESAPETVELTLDRPFIFAIIERETGAILFLGRVTNPAS
jgi:serpin B